MTVPATRGLTSERLAHVLHHTAAELRAFAERHPGKRIPHFVAPGQSVFLTCQPEDLGLLWTLRLACYNAARPQPFTLADDAWRRTIEHWRNLFAVPSGAVQHYDPALDGLDDTRGYAVLITWREINSAAQPNLL